MDSIYITIEFGSAGALAIHPFHWFLWPKQTKTYTAHVAKHDKYMYSFLCLSFNSYNE